MRNQKIIDFTQKTEKNFINFIKGPGDLTEIVQDVDDLFNASFDILSKGESAWQSFFLRKSWSLFLSSLRIAAGGQSSDIYPLTRIMLESALYCWFIHQDPNRLELWMNRRLGDEEKKKMKKTFANHRIFKEFKNKEPITSKIIENTYEFHIEFGAHPNPSGIMSGIKEIGNSMLFNCDLIHQTDEDSYHLAIEKTAQAGIETLLVFRSISSDKFESLNKRFSQIMMALDLYTSKL